jgi:hypothetical protein
MKSGYHQIPMKTDAIAKTAFVTPDGLYHLKRVSFALTNAPSDFQRLINVVFGSLRYDTALAYKGCFFKFGVEVGVGESIEIAPLV